MCVMLPLGPEKSDRPRMTAAVFLGCQLCGRHSAKDMTHVHSFYSQSSPKTEVLSFSPFFN